MTARDVGRAVRSEKLDVPFGISTTINGRTRNYTMADAPACPLRDELREAALSCIADRGGTAKSVSTVTKIVRAARMSVITPQPESMMGANSNSKRFISVFLFGSFAEFSMDAGSGYQQLTHRPFVRNPCQCSPICCPASLN